MTPPSLVPPTGAVALFRPLCAPPGCVCYRCGIHTSHVLADKERHRPSSKVEETVECLRERMRGERVSGGSSADKPLPESKPLSSSSINDEPRRSQWAQSASTGGGVVDTSQQMAPVSTPPAPAKRSLAARVMDELRHYYHGFKLLVINTSISGKLLWRLLKGESLTRREHRQLVRTVGDLFRVVPFSVFIIIPFMELLLPVFIKLFPNMLPSTFQTANEQEAKMKQKLKLKLETAKFLQKTLDSMALKGKGHHSDSAKEFADFFKQVRSSGEQATNDQIIRFSKLFEDELTLDSLQRAQLTALCRVLEVQPFGTDNFLRFLINTKLRRLAADDRVIFREGIDVLSVPELQQAVRARGMRSYGVSEQRLRSQLSQWIDLSLNERVPPSLLLLSRALYLPENIPPRDQLVATISQLPESLETATRAAIGDREGCIDFKTRVDLVKEEERRIQEEREETLRLQQQQQAAAVVDSGALSTATDETSTQLHDIAVDISVDKSAAAAGAVEGSGVEKHPMAPEATASSRELTSRDVADIEDALQHVATDKHQPLLEREELQDIKEELADYKEDLSDLESVARIVGEDAKNLRETKAAKRLFKGLNRLIGSLDRMLAKLKDGELVEAGKELKTVEASSGEVSIAEVIQSLRSIQGLANQEKLDVVADVLSQMDHNQDGSVRVEDIHEVIEFISQDNVHLTGEQMKEIIELLDREKLLDLEQRIERVLSHESAADELVTLKSETAHANSR